MRLGLSGLSAHGFSLGLAISLALGLVCATTPASLAQPAPSAPGSTGSQTGSQADKAAASQPPAALSQVLAAADQAASQRNLELMLQSYSNNFRNSDGLNRRALGQSLTTFWQQYPQLSYQTEILRWEKTATGWMAETEARIQGSREVDNRRLALNSTLRSRQYIENNQIARQDILSEQSTVTTGDRPPTLQVNLPEQVSPGQSFAFDVIVLEPIEKDLLLGGIVDEPVSAQGYGSVSEASLEPLIDAKTGTGPGGLFKIGQAPAKGSDRWISAVVMRKDGITMVTQRLRVGDR